MVLHNKKCLFYQYILGSLNFCSTNELPDSTSSQAALHSQGAMCSWIHVQILQESLFFVQLDYKHELGGLCKSYGRPNLGCIWKLQHGRGRSECCHSEWIASSCK